MVKDLYERYDAITKLKGEIDEKFETIPSLSDTFNAQLDRAIFEMQTVLLPEAQTYKKKLDQIKIDSDAIDQSDSHIFVNSVRYIFVLYVVYAIVFICGIVYIAKANDSNAQSVMYVQYALLGSVVLWVWYHLTDYIK